MRYRMGVLLMGLAGAFLVLCLLFVPLEAAFPRSLENGEVLGVSPSRIRVEVEPGGSCRERVDLINLGSRDITVRPVVRALQLTDSGVAFGLSPQCGWVRVEGEAIGVPAGGIRTVDLWVRVPLGERPKAYRLAVVFRQEGGVEEGMCLTTAVAVTLELAVLAPSGSAERRGSSLMPLLLLGFTIALFLALILFFVKLGKRLWKG